MHQPSGRRGVPSGPSSVTRSFELLPLASVWTFQHPVRTILSVRSSFRISCQTQIWECYNCPDTFIHKASITIQIQTSGRQSAWSGRAFIRYGNCLHQIGCLDDRSPGSDTRSLYLEITYSGRATVRTIWHHRPEASLKQERSSVKFLEFRSHSCLS
jgi:hypothetical protein